jgi:AcrR family transcriptional regulator
MTGSEKKTADHRPRVAAQRRAAMQRRLLLAALQVLSKRQISDISVTDLISQENVSRGTFYRYFDSLSQVYSTLFEKLAEELAPIADLRVSRIPDPALRVATGTRLVLHLGSSMPLFGKLMVQSGWPISLSAPSFLGFLDRDIQLATAKGVFEDMPRSVASNLIIGPMLGGLATMLRGQERPDYAEQITIRILVSLGMGRGAAERAVEMPIPELSLPSIGLIGDILKNSAPTR